MKVPNHQPFALPVPLCSVQSKTSSCSGGTICFTSAFFFPALDVAAAPSAGPAVWPSNHVRDNVRSSPYCMSLKVACSAFLPCHFMQSL
jgi:hypothetical protein